MNANLVNIMAVLAGMVPLLHLLAGAFPAARRCAVWGAPVAALLAAALLGGAGAVQRDLLVAGPFRLGIYFDRLTALLLILVSLLLAVILRYSCNYLAGDPGRERFLRWLSGTGGSVLAILVADNLVQLAAAWMATSLCLHRLLVFYPDRSGARLAARKKFILSRAGDACLLGAIGLVYHRFHAGDYATLFADAAGAPTGPAVTLAVFLIALCAMLKSAQFPFHSWLPDTMETPTPVSALMHAGIINAGGFLILRLSPLVVLTPSALTLLAAAGAFTALFASFVMLTHASVKRALAFSTVAQMGFMMLECGLGAFSLAVLHLAAHSLYKAHAFLASGNAVSTRAADQPGGTRPPHAAARLALAVLMAWAVTFGVQPRLIPALAENPQGLLFAGVFLLALVYGLWNGWNRWWSWPAALLGGLVAKLFALAGFGLHRVFAAWLDPVLGRPPAMGGAPILTVLGLFLLALGVQLELSVRPGRPFYRWLYVHARNGFYFNTLANRALLSVWPPAKNKS